MMAAAVKRNWPVQQYGSPSPPVVWRSPSAASGHFGGSVNSGDHQRPLSPGSKMNQDRLEFCEQGNALKVRTDAPHLVSLGSGRLSTAITLQPLPEGKTSTASWYSVRHDPAAVPWRSSHPLPSQQQQSMTASATCAHWPNDDRLGRRPALHLRRFRVAVPSLLATRWPISRRHQFTWPETSRRPNSH
jgi:hypothetical protein